ncbi:MAG: regulatory signaling modulator protein AmpE [Acidiferrobacterales bacterium]
MAHENLRLLAGVGVDELGESAIARHSVEAVLKQGNAVVIAPLFWFVVLGPVFAVLQRLTNTLAERGGGPGESGSGTTASAVDGVIAWIPVRITAFSYAIVGSFEDALRCWRAAMRLWSEGNATPLVAAGLGAMQLQRCEEMPATVGQNGAVAFTPVALEPDHIRSAVAMLWRALLFWLAVAVLLLLAVMLG